MSVRVCALRARSTSDLSVWVSAVCWGWRQGLRVQRAHTLMCTAGSAGTTAPAPVTGDLVTLCWFMCVTVARPRNLSTYSPPIPTVTSPSFYAHILIALPHNTSFLSMSFHRIYGNTHISPFSQVELKIYNHFITKSTAWWGLLRCSVWVQRAFPNGCCVYSLTTYNFKYCY